MTSLAPTPTASSEEVRPTMLWWRGWRVSVGCGGWCGRERRQAGWLAGGSKVWRDTGAAEGPAGGEGRRAGEDGSSSTHVTQQRGVRAGRRGRAASPRLGCPPPRGSVTPAQRGRVGQEILCCSSASQPPTLSGPASALAPSRESQEWVEEEGTFLGLPVAWGPDRLWGLASRGGGGEGL